MCDDWRSHGEVATGERVPNVNCTARPLTPCEERLEAHFEDWTALSLKNTFAEPTHALN